MAKFDPFLSLDCAHRPPKKGRDQILSSGNLGDRLVHLQSLLDANVTVEILNLDGFAGGELYSFDVPGLDRCGSCPDESCKIR